MSEYACSPFVKWPGGKAGLLPQLFPLLPRDGRDRRHVEPFVGGGALFFARRPTRGLLADVNPRLVATYCAVRDYPEGVIDMLREFAARHRRDAHKTYYDARAAFNATPRLSGVALAAHFIYLNKTCFNGLYRENKKGEFNAALGAYKDPAIADEKTLMRASAALAGIEVVCASFEATLGRCGPGDFIYLDPPYEPISETEAFTAYAATGFVQADQRRLAELFRRLDQQGARVMMSNSSAPIIRELYEGYRIDDVHARRSINCAPDRRGKVPEVVVRNYSNE